MRDIPSSINKLHSPEDERKWWQHLHKVADKEDVKKFWADYARYLKDHGIISPQRELLYKMAKKVSEL